MSDPKKGTGKKPKGSDRRLYTDENPKDTVSIKFATVQDAKATIAKVKKINKPYARKIQILTVLEQRAKVAGKSEQARLAKKAKVGVGVGNCVQYLILIYFPLIAGGGTFCIKGKMVSFNFDVLILWALFLNTSMASSSPFNNLCFSKTEMNKIGTSEKGDIFFLISLPYSSKS